MRVHVYECDAHVLTEGFKKKKKKKKKTPPHTHTAGKPGFTHVPNSPFAVWNPPALAPVLKTKQREEKN